MTEEKIRLSKSGYMCYLYCPRKFKYLYIDKVEVVPSPQMVRGKEFHKFVEDFYTKVKIINDELVLSDYSIVNEEIKELILNFINLEKKRWTLCKDSKYPKIYYFPRYQEIRIDTIDYKGIIDRIDVHTDGGLIIHEIKTGNMNWKNVKKELYFYKMLFETEHTDKKIEYLCGYCPENNTVKFEKVDYVEYEKIKKEINETLINIRSGIFPKKEGWLCPQYCPCYFICAGDE